MIETLASLESPRQVAPAVKWPNSPVPRSHGVASALDRVRQASSILEAIRERDGLVLATQVAIDEGLTADALLAPMVEAIDDTHDTVTGLAAVHAMARIQGPAVDAILSRIGFDGPDGFETHVAWAMAGREASPWLIDLMSGVVVRGGLAGMHAQAALSEWGLTHDQRVLDALGRRMAAATGEAQRRHLVETVGLVPGVRARSILERIAGDATEPDSVRAVAVLAFAERSSERLPRSFVALARSDGSIADEVGKVRALRRLQARGPRRTHDRADGIKVAQVHLGAVIDETMSMAGVGSTGGVATLLSSLATSLARQARITEVTTISREAPGESRRRPRSQAGHRYESVPLHDGEGATFTSSWPSLVAARRGIRAALLASGVPDVMHLRMADPGSMAASTVARQYGIPTVFTLAPDPHGPVNAAETGGHIDRRTFARSDASSAYWFRIDLVDRLQAQAREVVLFPRARLRTELRDLVGLDLDDGPPRYTIVPEGIDTDVSRRAAAEVKGNRESAVLTDLESSIRRLPPVRHGLPIVVSVGRLDEMKGMARIVEAFAQDEDLASRANLAIVGGDLARPNAIEAAELARIEGLFSRHAGLRDAVVMLGHRPNDDVSLVLAAAHSGWRSVVAPGGVYVCGSRKEEFGLAIVEAMAAGLPVVAPHAGGPASYVREGKTGILVDTADPARLGAGMARGLELAADPLTATLGRQTVSGRYTIDRMARTLAALYRVSAGARTLARPVRERAA